MPRPLDFETILDNKQTRRINLSNLNRNVYDFLPTICPELRTNFVSYFFVIVIVTVTVIVLYTMFILELWTELEDKHC